MIMLATLCALVTPPALLAQDDGQSLGDIARDMRRNKAQQGIEQQQPAPAPPVIDNDNLSQAIQDVRRLKSAEKIVFSIDPDGKGLRLTSPDINCSLAFNGRNSSLLFQPQLIEDLPLADLLKLDGPGSIEDDTLQLEISNGTEWELREITVGITLERNGGANADLAARARVIPASENSAAVTVERRSDMTLLFHLKTDAKPFSATIFRENIGITPTADEDWRWSIVSAKGVRSGSRLSAPEPLPTVPQMPLPSPMPPAPDSAASAVPSSTSGISAKTGPYPSTHH
jgi:hypothetical protein